LGKNFFVDNKIFKEAIYYLIFNKKFLCEKNEKKIYYLKKDKKREKIIKIKE